MQVMPIHAGARLCNSDDLVDVDSNICHGTLILARNLRRHQLARRGPAPLQRLRAGAPTPRTATAIPPIVLARASQVRREILLASQLLPPAALDSLRPIALAGS